MKIQESFINKCNVCYIRKLNNNRGLGRNYIMQRHTTPLEYTQCRLASPKKPSPQHSPSRPPPTYHVLLQIVRPRTRDT